MNGKSTMRMCLYSFMVACMGHFTNNMPQHSSVCFLNDCTVTFGTLTSGGKSAGSSWTINFDSRCPKVCNCVCSINNDCRNMLAPVVTSEQAYFLHSDFGLGWKTVRKWAGSCCLRLAHIACSDCNGNTLIDSLKKRVLPIVTSEISLCCYQFYIWSWYSVNRWLISQWESVSYGRCCVNWPAGSHSSGHFKKCNIALHYAAAECWGTEDWREAPTLCLIKLTACG